MKNKEPELKCVGCGSSVDMMQIGSRPPKIYTCGNTQVSCCWTASEYEIEKLRAFTRPSDSGDEIEVRDHKTGRCRGWSRNELDDWEPFWKHVDAFFSDAMSDSGDEVERRFSDLAASLKMTPPELEKLLHNHYNEPAVPDSGDVEGLLKEFAIWMHSDFDGNKLGISDKGASNMVTAFLKSPAFKESKMTLEEIKARDEDGPTRYQNPDFT